MRSGLERRCVIREPWNPNHEYKSYAEHQEDSCAEIRVEHLIYDHENNQTRCAGKCRTLVEANNFESELREALKKLKASITYHSKAVDRADRDYEL